jgi:predicted Zn-dependent protease
MLLAKRGESLDEALKLAQGAAKSGDGKIVSFYDTLAFVLLQRKEYAAALETLDAALKLKPDHLWCQLRLTDVLAQSGQTDKARAALKTLEKELAAQQGMSDEMSSHLADLRSRLGRQES